MLKLAEAIASIRKELPAVQAIYLFGSQASGEARAESDVDLAVLLPEKIDPVARWELAGRLAVLLGRDVDLVDLRSASAVLRVQVLDGGRLLDEQDVFARAEFEMYALSDYARLNEERKWILADVRARGGVNPGAVHG